MRKLPKAAVAAAAIALVGFIGTGTASAQSAEAMHGGGSGCRSHDLNLELLSNIGIANGLLGNVLNGEGNPGGQANHIGSECG